MKDPHWSFFLPAGEQVRLLELGSGTGARSCHFARRVGRVETLSFSETQRQEVAARAQACGLDNVRPQLYRPGSRLGFEDGAFDGLIVDRMLGYPAANGSKTREAERFLAEAHRVLTPDGVLYVGAENRLFHLLGLSAAFGRLRKSRVHPDRDLEANLEALGHEREDRLTLASYRELLRSAGFGKVRTFAPLPDAVRPQAVVSLDGTETQRFLFRHRVRRHSPKTRTAAALGRIAVGTGLLARVVPFYYLVATK